MPPTVFASLAPGAGRTTAVAAIGALFAERGRAARLLRVRADGGADPAAEDDARVLASVPGCDAPSSAVSEQDAAAQAKEAGSAAQLCLIEAPAGAHDALVERLGARAVLVTAGGGVEDLAPAAARLGAALLGVVALRLPPRHVESAAAAIEARGPRCLAALPEDRLLAGPSVGELAEALHASTLVDGDVDEAVEHVMIGPVTADPGQPYFLQHGRKAVIQRFDKMDLHLAALATGPVCVVLTGGQQPSPYFLDRVQGSDAPVTVLLAPDGTTRAMELVDELYGRTRFAGAAKLERAVALFRERAQIDAFL
jgi:hypothetical protein